MAQISSRPNTKAKENSGPRAQRGAAAAGDRGVRRRPLLVFEAPFGPATRPQALTRGWGTLLGEGLAARFREKSAGEAGEGFSRRT